MTSSSASSPWPPPPDSCPASSTSGGPRGTRIPSPERVEPLQRRPSRPSRTSGLAPAAWPWAGGRDESKSATSFLGPTLLEEVAVAAVQAGRRHVVLRLDALHEALDPRNEPTPLIRSHRPQGRDDELGLLGLDQVMQLLLGIPFFIPSAPFPPKARGRRGGGGKGLNDVLLQSLQNHCRRARSLRRCPDTREGGRKRLPARKCRYPCNEPLHG
jgi:hypothetical protein